MARAIDVEKAIEIIEEKQKQLCPVGRYGRNYVYGSDREKYDAWEEIIDALDNLPTLTPPNETLTIEQLREMDGEPVWVVPRGMHEKDEPMWCVLESPMALIPGVDYWSWDFDGYGETWIAYRRPPEGEEDT